MSFRDLDNYVVGMQYLDEVGVRIRVGVPDSDQSWPFFVLKQPNQRLEGFPVTETTIAPLMYIVANLAVPLCLDEIPDKPADAWVECIEEMVLSIIADPRWYTEFNKKPMEVFLADPVWNSVAFRLAVKYPGRRK